MDMGFDCLRVLFLEDSDKDIEIVYQKLADDFGCSVHMDSAASKIQFMHLIENNEYDLILADYTLPGYNAQAALEQARAVCPETPFIVVSGTIGEDVAVELLKQGATDYVLKDRLGRLSFAVLRALEGAKKEREKKHAERALRAAYESNRLVLDSISDGVAMFDKDGTIININAEFAERLGSTVIKMIGTKRELYLHMSKYGNLLQKRRAKFDSVFDTGKPENFEDSRDGRVYKNRYYPVFKDGAVSAVTLFSSDITDQKRAEEEARKLAETETRLSVMTEFFTNVSHELKTPLSLILMQLDMMRMHLGNEKKMQDLMADATLNAYRLTRLVSNLLDITKMDAGFLKLNLRNRDIVNMLKHICESVADYAKAKKISLDFTSGVPAKAMDLDGDKVERAILNLLSNAIKHTPENGAISVGLKDNGDSVTVSVKDTGEGIPADKLDLVFDRFVQVNNKLSRSTEGSGIGLTLVKSMVELHGGRVWAESKLGQGSTFTVELPVKNSETANKSFVIEGFDLNKKVKMELSDLYIKLDA